MLMVCFVPSQAANCDELHEGLTKKYDELKVSRLTQDNSLSYLGMDIRLDNAPRHSSA